MLKICHVITRFILGGAQENTLASLVGLAERGHDVTLLAGPSCGPEGNLLEQKNLHNSNLPFKFIELPQLVREINPVYDFVAYKKLAAKFEKEKYDIIHTHSSKAGILGRLAASNVRAKKISKVVHTIHGLAFDEHQPFWKNKLYITAEKICAKKSDKIISVCNAMTEQALDAGVGSQNLFTTIYSAFDIEKFISAKALKKSARRKFAIEEKTTVFLFIGRLFNMKGAEDFITLFEKLSEKNDFPVKGILIGDGILRKKLEARVKKSIPNKNITFTGLLPPDEIPEWIAAADVIVHTSLREGLARVLVQALAAGKPVISYDVGGAKEVVKDCENGFIISPSDIDLLIDRAEKLLTDKNLLERMSEKAAQTNLNKFSVKTMVDEIEKVYKQI